MAESSTGREGGGGLGGVLKKNVPRKVLRTLLEVPGYLGIQDDMKLKCHEHF